MEEIKDEDDVVDNNHKNETRSETNNKNIEVSTTEMKSEDKKGKRNTNFYEIESERKKKKPRVTASSNVVAESTEILKPLSLNTRVKVWFSDLKNYYEGSIDRFHRKKSNPDIGRFVYRIKWDDTKLAKEEVELMWKNKLNDISNDDRWNIL